HLHSMTATGRRDSLLIYFRHNGISSERTLTSELTGHEANFFIPIGPAAVAESRPVRIMRDGLYTRFNDSILLKKSRLARCGYPLCDSASRLEEMDRIVAGKPALVPIDC